MWNLTLEAKETFEKSNLLLIHESDDEWEAVLREAKEEGVDIHGELRDELEEVKTELYQIVPKRFHPYIESGTLNQPDLPLSVREDYLSWIEEREEAFSQILTLASEQTEKAAEYLAGNVQRVFKEGFHDALIEKLERNRDCIMLKLECGGFSLMDRVYLQFHGVAEEISNEGLTAGETIVYDELQYINNMFHLRVLTDELEWTIVFKDVTADYYFRPGLYTQLALEEKLENMTLIEYLQQLNSEQTYWFITPDIEERMTFTDGQIVLEHGELEISGEAIRVIDKEQVYVYTFDEYYPAQFIYTDVYENPEENLEELLPENEIIPAIFGENISLQVQAWNSMYNEPEAYKEKINQVLAKVQQTEENEMFLSIYLERFSEYNVLNSSNSAKFKYLLEDA
ncbi:DUF4085 family protein [Oceanobacillus sp. FSL H7-0719]|uniref:DUF4085 family protein n=1 Tax=Oceanobacillus sp. FSL H7-0719 TaxID=2954507 RepID=UPI0032552515